ncbi:MAG: DUF1178 family protein [Acetobacteraceae bacterium]
MIHYQLRCQQGHEFDGWFNDSAGFERQAARRLIACPECADTSVSRALMAPALGRGAKAPPEPPAAPAPAPAPSAAPSPPPGAAPPGTEVLARMPDKLRAALARMRAEVESHCDYVGPAFAEEARRIHDGTAPPRGIYGETTPDQAEALEADGIAFARIPWVPRADG